MKIIVLLTVCLFALPSLALPIWNGASLKEGDYSFRIQVTGMDLNDPRLERISVTPGIFCHSSSPAIVSMTVRDLLDADTGIGDESDLETWSVSTTVAVGQVLRVDAYLNSKVKARSNKYFGKRYCSLSMIVTAKFPDSMREAGASIPADLPRIQDDGSDEMRDLLESGDLAINIDYDESKMFPVRDFRVYRLSEGLLEE